MTETTPTTGSPTGPPPAGDVVRPESALRASLIRAAGSLRVLAIGVALVVIWVFFSFQSEYFWTTENILNILLQSSNVAIIAAGLTVVMITAEIDLSIGTLQALSGSVVAVLIVNQDQPVWLAIAAGLGVTVLCGAISGLLTWKLKVVSFISTLAMLGIAQGAAFLLTNGQAVAGLGSTYAKIGTSKIYGVPTPVVIAVVVFVVLHLMLTRTTFGQRIYAVGGNAEAAAYAGINPGRVKLFALMLSGFTAGIGGLILSSRLDSGNGLYGEGDLLLAVAAVVIGGTSLFGGVGNVIGTAIGAVIIMSLYNGLLLMGVEDFWQRIVVGVLIITAVVIDQVVKRAWLVVR